MGDPREGLTASGTIRTGADVDQIPSAYRELLTTVVELVQATTPGASVYVYGSVATGQATPPVSDLDLLTIGLASNDATRIGAELTDRYRQLCRGVEIAASQLSDFDGDGDEAYGMRVFLRHYCVHLAGQGRDTSSHDFLGDRAAARGFNGDIEAHADRWHRDLGNVEAPELARRIARKMLLAVAGLVSVHDNTWTTDRDKAALRWSQIVPEQEAAMAEMQAWVADASQISKKQVAIALEYVVDPLVRRYEQDIGLWKR